MNMASIIATAFAILLNANAEAALTIAIPISVLGQILGILMRTILSNLTHVADRFIEQGNLAKQGEFIYFMARDYMLSCILFLFF